MFRLIHIASYMYAHEIKKFLLNDTCRYFLNTYCISVLLQLAIFITHEFNTAVIIEVLSHVFPTLVVIINYFFYIKSETVSLLLTLSIIYY